MQRCQRARSEPGTAPLPAPRHPAGPRRFLRYPRITSSGRREGTTLASAPYAVQNALQENVNEKQRLYVSWKYIRNSKYKRASNIRGRNIPKKRHTHNSNKPTRSEVHFFCNSSAHLLHPSWLEVEARAHNIKIKLLVRLLLCFWSLLRLRLGLGMIIGGFRDDHQSDQHPCE